MHPTFAGDRLNPAFASDLTEAGRPDLWSHGHTQLCFDYRVECSRILAYPRGHPGENRDSDPPLLVVEVGR